MIHWINKIRRSSLNALFIGFFLCILVHQAQSQKMLQAGISGGVAFPFLGFDQYNPLGALSLDGGVDMGYGGTAHLKYFPAKWFGLGLNVGYFHFPGASYEDDSLGVVVQGPHVATIPITLSTIFYPQFGGNDPYLRPQMGFDFGMYIVDPELDNPSVDFGFALVIGSGYKVTPKIDVYANARPHFILNDNNDWGFASYMDINIGVMYNLVGAYEEAVFTK